MTQNSNIAPSRSASLTPAFTGVAIYTHPEDVAKDPKLTLAEKRQVLASWISDVRTVENAPAFRCLFSGAVVKVDDILRVLVALDKPTISPEVDWQRTMSPKRGVLRRSVFGNLLKRAKPLHRSNDNDGTRHRPLPD